jgi:hypothetical protein
VLGFSFDIETGELTTLVIGALGVPLLGEGVLSTWELAVTEIVSSGPDRIIVYEGAEEKLRQLGTGLLEKLGVGGASWEQEERERFRQTMVPVENQLAAGQPSTQEQQRRIAPATNRRLEVEEDYDYVEVEPRREREPLRQRRYLDDDRDPERETPSRYTTENEARGRDGWRRDDRAGSNRYEDDRFDADRQQNNRLETNPGRTDRYSQERFNPADFDADFDEERLNEARAKQMRPNHDRSSSTASSIPDNSQPYGDSRSNQTGAERYSDLRQSSEGAATASSRQSPTYPPQPLQRERDDRIEAERLDRDRNSDIYSGEARQRAAERRYVRDEGPLDVEPLAEDRPASRRSEASDDPW